MRRLVIMGAGGRDFHNFNVVFRDDPATEVVAFTAEQIPGIDSRTYPAALAGPRYPDGIPIRPEREVPDLIRDERVDEVVFAYSDVAHADVMHRAAIVQAAGADFTLLGPRSTMLRSSKPVVAVCAVRTGCGKSQTTRRVGRILLDAGLRVALIRHPMPYGDLRSMRVQRFTSLEDIDASHPTIEEREEYERPVEMGMVMFSGVDYAEILAAAEAEADVIVWDGGNNDFPFVAPDVHIVLADPLRSGHETAYHPGETNLRMADVLVVNKVDTAPESAVDDLVGRLGALRPGVPVVRAASPVTLASGPSLAGAAVLLVDDGPTITHGGMPFGAASVAARAAHARIVDPRPYAVGSIAETFRRFPHITETLPAMGYGDAQLRELEATIDAVPCDAVIAGTPFALGRVVRSRRPIRQASYELEEQGQPTLAALLEPVLARAGAGAR